MADEEEERRTVPFADTLQKLQRGRTARELAAEMQALVEAVMETGRAGTLTLQLKVSKSKASGMVEIADSYAAKLPRADREVSMFFVTDDHNLTREDPRQLAFDVGPVRAVDEAPAAGVAGAPVRSPKVVAE